VRREGRGTYGEFHVLLDEPNYPYIGISSESAVDTVSADQYAIRYAISFQSAIENIDELPR